MSRTQKVYDPKKLVLSGKLKGVYFKKYYIITKS
jgi:hypothetical protein